MAKFQRLSRSGSQNFAVNSKRAFNPLFSLNDFLPQAFDFAYAMCFTDGHHRNIRSGGQIHRSQGELFINTLQGKLAEFGIYRKFSEHGITLPPPDLNVMGKGIWDNGDFDCLGYKLSIKSAAHFSNLMLLETKDWDEEAHYIPDGSSYDFFILCRIKPDGKALFGHHPLLAPNKPPYEALKALFLAENWEFDIAGCIGKGELKELIKREYILPQKALLNGKIIMDARNYYAQSGDMHTFEQLLQRLNPAIP
ncbi:hypothetical protein VRU48_07025 [Pedobacter sp. KR3-3]|uniref:Restriction endonuclease n=1 Tax=Pedobacter albus TaxID=3113905 RepID=A0ABU7I5W1_9SPHI|nr:hypothetical protein [Pedobacter sp. KR3-3]MEE1944851.1 hypothetical protein [Pedobacter sp. KR3-3]